MGVDDTREEIAAAFLQRTFPNVDDRVRGGDVPLADVLSTARVAIDALYPDASCAFIFGSIVAGRFKPFSDLDIAVFLPAGEEWALRCVEHDGFLLEIHAYPIASVDLMINFARFSGQMFALVVARDGLVLIDRSGSAEMLRAKFSAAFEAGPLPKPAGFIDELRFQLTGALIDLGASTQTDEMIAIGQVAYGVIIRLAQAIDGHWQHNGKWAARDLSTTRPALLAGLRTGMAALCDGQPVPFLRTGTALLEEVGGGRWTGHAASFAMADQAKLMPLLKALRSRVI